jgi:hypothetical protein
MFIHSHQKMAGWAVLRAITFAAIVRIPNPRQNETSRRFEHGFGD